MSSDVLLSLSEHLDARDRINLSVMSKHHYELLSQWHDVTNLVYDDKFAAMAGKKFTHSIEKNVLPIPSASETFLSMLLKQCPNIHKVCIQKRMTASEVEALADQSDSIKRLSLAADNFVVVDGIRRSTDFIACRFNKLKSLNVLERTNRKNGVETQMTKEDAKIFFVPTLQKVRLTGMALRSEVLSHICTLTELRDLSLIGCLVDTVDCTKCNFDSLLNLEFLSIPPSLYSLSKPDSKEAKKAKPPFSLRHCTNLHTLAMHVHSIDEEHLFGLVQSFFPPNLKVLQVHGSNRKLPTTKTWKQFNKFTIQFATPEMTVRDYWWCRGKSTLIRHMEWSWPYVSLKQTTNTGAEVWKFSAKSLTTPILKSLPMPEPRKIGGETIVNIMSPVGPRTPQEGGAGGIADAEEIDFMNFLGRITRQVERTLELPERPATPPPGPPPPPPPPIPQDDVGEPGAALPAVANAPPPNRRTSRRLPPPPTPPATSTQTNSSASSGATTIPSSSTESNASSAIRRSVSRRRTVRRRSRSRTRSRSRASRR